jgi:hypothetical protein
MLTSSIFACFVPSHEGIPCTLRTHHRPRHKCAAISHRSGILMRTPMGARSPRGCGERGGVRHGRVCVERCVVSTVSNGRCRPWQHLRLSEPSDIAPKALSARGHDGDKYANQYGRRVCVCGIVVVVFRVFPELGGLIPAQLCDAPRRRRGLLRCMHPALEGSGFLSPRALWFAHNEVRDLETCFDRLQLMESNEVLAAKDKVQSAQATRVAALLATASEKTDFTSWYRSVHRHLGYGSVIAAQIPPQRPQTARGSARRAPIDGANTRCLPPLEHTAGLTLSMRCHLVCHPRCPLL